MVGVFNEITSADEKIGGSPVDTNRCNLFAQWINRCRLMDVEYVGSHFIWKGPMRDGLDRVLKHFDRALCNVA